MGALLSLPLLAVPSMGTVRQPSLSGYRAIMLTSTAYRFYGKLLRCGYMLCSMQCLWEMW